MKWQPVPSCFILVLGFVNSIASLSVLGDIVLLFQSLFLSLHRRIPLCINNQLMLKANFITENQVKLKMDLASCVILDNIFINGREMYYP